MPSTIISDIERQVRDRLKELEPLVAEYNQLLAVAESFEGSRSRATASGAARRSAPGRGRATRRRSGGRSEQALTLVAERPGITVAELADAMQIGPTYLYRVMPALEREGKVKKQGKGYQPA